MVPIPTPTELENSKNPVVLSGTQYSIENWVNADGALPVVVVYDNMCSPQLYVRQGYYDTRTAAQCG